MYLYIYIYQLRFAPFSPPYFSVLPILQVPAFHVSDCYRGRLESLLFGVINVYWRASWGNHN